MHDTGPVTTRPPTAAPTRWPLAGIAFAGMFVGGLILSMVLGTRTFPSPYDPATEIIGYFTDNAGPVRGLGLLHTLSAAALALFTVALANSAGNGMARAVAQSAGLIAAVFLLISGMCSIALVSDGVTGGGLRGLHALAFLSGGAMHVLFLGILVAAGTLALTGSAPRGITVLGWISAALSVAAIVSLIARPAVLLLPMGRFTAIAWIVATAIWLARRPAR